MLFVNLAIKLLVDFSKNVWGVINKPYMTYRKLVSEDPLQLLILFTIIGGYFFLVSPIKVHTFHPFLLTVNATRLFSTVLGTYLVFCILLLGIGKVLRGASSLRAVLLSWGYSLIPTLIWFFATSVFYVFLPPPRQETWPGRIFSILYISFSLALLLWKALLYYLTLRFAMKFELRRIFIASLIFVPAVFFYSVLMFQIGVFRMPFI